MASELPLWYGRPRGTDLSDLVGWVDEAAESPAGGRDVAAGVLGFLIPLAIVMCTMAAGQLPIAAMALLGLAGVAWLGAGLAAAWLLAFSEEEAPPWAETFVAVLVGLGHIIIVAAAIASVVAVLLFLIMLVMALASSDRR
jgi:hypothetical protein